MRTSALARLTTVLAAGVVSSVLVATPAFAEPAPPIAVDDSVSLYPGQLKAVDVLANDSAPSGDSLALCRFPDPKFTDHVVALEGTLDGSDRPGLVSVLSDDKARGTTVVDYYICDTVHLTPAHLDVTALPVSPVQVHKVAGKPGRLTVTNTNTVPVRFWYGDAKATHPDGKVTIPAGATKTVRVQRHRIIWVAFIGSGSVRSLYNGPGIADHGKVRGIKLKGKPLPAPKPSKEPFRLAGALGRLR